MIKLLFGAIILILGALIVLGFSLQAVDGQLAEGTLGVTVFSAVLLFPGWKLYQAGRQKMFLSSASYKMARDMYATDKRVNLDQIESNTESKIGIIKKVKRITGFATDADTIEKTLNALQKKGLFPVDAELYSSWTTLEDSSKKKWKWGGIAFSIWATLDFFEITPTLSGHESNIFKLLWVGAAGCFLAARKVRVRDDEDLLKLSCGRNVEFTCTIEGDMETMYKLWLTSDFININVNDSTVEKPYSSVQSVSLVQSKGRLAKTLQRNKKNWVSISFDDGQEFIFGFGGFGRKGAARKAEVVELIKSKAAEIKNIEIPEDKRLKLSSDTQPAGAPPPLPASRLPIQQGLASSKPKSGLLVGVAIIALLAIVGGFIYNSSTPSPPSDPPESAEPAEITDVNIVLKTSKGDIEAVIYATKTGNNPPLFQLAGHEVRPCQNHRRPH